MSILKAVNPNEFNRLFEENVTFPEFQPTTFGLIRERRPAGFKGGDLNLIA